MGIEYPSMEGEVRKSTRLGSHMTIPFDRKFSGCRMNGMFMAECRNPYPMYGSTFSI